MYARLVCPAAAILAVVASLVAAPTSSAATITRDVPSAGTFTIPNAPAPHADAGGGFPELRPSSPDADPLDKGAVVLRGGTRHDRHGKHGNRGHGGKPRLAQSFDGLNFFDSRFANGGNQFSNEPPDQGLCVGNGKVVEIINSVYQVFDSRGRALINPVDVNTLFGYPAAINRSTGAIGPDVFDTSCLFDQKTGMFVVLASTLDVDSSGALTGSSHVDVGVAQDPTKAYTIYRIPTASDGCFNDAAQKEPGPCFPDFPHLGADANGVYITTNVFDFFGPNFEGARIDALPKALLASTPFSVPTTTIETNGVGPADDGGFGFSVIPAVSPGKKFADANGGTEYFASSRAVFTDAGTSSSLVVRRLANTQSLGSTPNLQLSADTVGVGEYGVPVPPSQKGGSVPLATCLGSTTNIPALGRPCWSVLGPGLGFSGPVNLNENVLDGNDSRVGGVSYANGELWVALGSAATDSGGNPVDGVAWFVLDPRRTPAVVVNQGMLTSDGTNLTYPSIAATDNGRAAMGFTIVGPNDYPGAAYAGVDDRNGTSDPQIAAAGAGPQDGFSEYEPFFSDGSPRPRWGDYGAAVADGQSIWVASEYIGQTCSFQDYLQASPSNASVFGTCHDTRAPLGNWDTRISELRP